MFLECKKISKVFKDPKIKKDIVALRDINLTVKKNEFLCIIGPIGCGKTTLLHMIAGLEKPTVGHIYLEGKEIKRPSPQRAVIFQEFSLFPWKTVLENIEFGLYIQGRSKKEQREIAYKYLNIVELEDFDNARPHQLSEGMKQKVTIARTLALDPDILLMDEPFGSLDQHTKDRLDLELLNIWEKETKTAIFVTHCIEEAVALADRIILFTARPGQIQCEFKLDLPRPRNLFSEKVIEIRKELLKNFMADCSPDERD